MSDRSDAAWVALREGRWSDAKAAFAEELRAGEDPVLLEGYGRATRWLDELTESFEAQERAFLLYKERGDAEAAANVAINLACDIGLTRADDAIARGWFARAEKLLATVPESAIHAWLPFRRGQVAFYDDNDMDGASTFMNEALEIARRHHDVDVEMGALSQLGLIDVVCGEIDAGMRLLDEAATAAVSGEIDAMDVAGKICCDVIFACEWVRDVDRASQWCDAATAIAEKGMLSPLMGACRAHYASILMWKGEWEKAEQQLHSANELMERHARAISREWRERLSELRRMQGRLDEAWQLCEPVEWSPGAKLCQARIAFDRGDTTLAGDLLERHFRSLRPEQRLARVGGLELAVTVRLALGEPEHAEAAAAELERMAERIDTGSMAAAARLARARVLAAAGDDAAALPGFEASVDLWNRAGSLYEAALARRELAATLTRMGRDEAARAELDRADAVLSELGAASPAAPAVGAGETSSSGRDGGLTPREIEVLRLVAEGMSDDQVAEALIVSPHTVHRHMANIRGKLDQPSRAAAAAFATREGLI